MAPLRRALCLVIAACMLVQADAVKTQHRNHGGMNPIRKVVNLLMMMQKKVEAEGKQEAELYEKFMCNVNGMTAGLKKSIADAQERIPQLESGIKETSAEHQQLTEDLKQAKEDREKATKAIATATSIREKEAAEFAKESANQKADIAAVEKAVAALEKGLSGGAFLQSTGGVLKRLAADTNVDLSDVDRGLLSSFLQGGGQEQQPSSGEVVGILKQMHDEMKREKAEMESAEDSAVADHEALVVAKKKEVAAATKAIEVKTGRKGELAVELTKLQNDLEDAKDGLAEDANVLANLDTSSKRKEAEFDAFKKTQAEELVALADTIKLLNDDDALDLFKKTLPQPGASFIQMTNTPKQMKKHALRVLRGARHRGHKKGKADPRLDLLTLWIQGRQGGSFDEVLKKIDKLKENLKKEQDDDDSKKDWCIAELDKTEDEVKATARTVSDVKKVIASSNEDLKAINAEIAAITIGIKELDSSVAKATEQRKVEHAASTNALADNNAAKQLLTMAKNRLAKFYNPKLEELQTSTKSTAPVYDADLVDGPAASDDDDDSEDEAPAFVQIEAHSVAEDEETVDDASSSDSQESAESAESSEQEPKKRAEDGGGVMGMLTTLKEDVSKQVLEIELEEKDAQNDYEVFMKDSSDKRALDSKAVADKESGKALIETDIQKAKVKLDGESESLANSQQELLELHADCDWLLKSHDARKSAREDEADALTKARAVLSGADYS